METQVTNISTIIKSDMMSFQLHKVLTDHKEEIEQFIKGLDPRISKVEVDRISFKR